MGDNGGWLNERESRVWRSFLAMHAALVRGADRQLSSTSALSIADYALLVPLSEAPGLELRARDLARSVDWERSRLSHQIRRMERRGLLVRRGCPTDARGIVIALTREGLEAVRDAAPAHVEWVREHFVDLLSAAELETLGAVAERVLATLVDECGLAGWAEACPDEVERARSARSEELSRQGDG